MLYNACDYGHKQNHKDNQGGFIMSVNGVSAVANQAYATDSYGSAKKSSTKDKVSEESKVDKGVVYNKTSVSKMSESEREETIKEIANILKDIHKNVVEDKSLDWCSTIKRKNIVKLKDIVNHTLKLKSKK